MTSFTDEVIKPIEQQELALTASVKKIYPQATPLMVGIAIIVGNIILGKMLSNRREDFEDRLSYAAKRILPRQRQKRKRK